MTFFILLKGGFGESLRRVWGGLWQGFGRDLGSFVEILRSSESTFEPVCCFWNFLAAFLVFLRIRCLLGFAGLRWALLGFAGLCWTLLVFAGLCSALLGFVGLCWVLLVFVGFVGFAGFAVLCRALLRFAGLCCASLPLSVARGDLLAVFCFSYFFVACLVLLGFAGLCCS